MKFEFKILKFSNLENIGNLQISNEVVLILDNFLQNKNGGKERKSNIFNSFSRNFENNNLGNIVRSPKNEDNCESLTNTDNIPEEISESLEENQNNFKMSIDLMD